MKIVVLDDFQNVAAQCADWPTLGSEFTVEFLHHHLATDTALVNALRDAEIVVAMRERTAFSADRLRQLPKLRLLVTTGMRNPSIDMAAAAAQGIWVCGTPSQTVQTAELTWAMILGLYKDIVANDHDTRRGAWQRRMNRSVRDDTLGLVGLGSIGAEMASIARAFHMRVLAWSPNLSPERCAEHGVTYADRETLFRQSDIVSVHMVLGPSTRGLIGERELGWMKPDAYLVNTSRGPLIDEAALIRALQEARLAGAGLDVFDQEPLPADAAILQAPRTLLSPHMGYVSWQNYRTYYEGAVAAILAWRQQQPIRVLAQPAGG